MGLKTVKRRVRCPGGEPRITTPRSIAYGMQSLEFLAG